MLKVNDVNEEGDDDINNLNLSGRYQLTVEWFLPCVVQYKSSVCFESQTVKIDVYTSFLMTVSSRFT